MDTLLLMIVCGAGFIVAYYTYGRFLARKIFQLSPDAPVPSRQLQDGIDYVPTRRGIIFGHHFASIAGTGPIVGPAIGIIWGWLPAILWVLLGSILMGAVHDFGTLVVSLRNEGKSISEIAAKYINSRVRLMFFAIVFLALWLVIAIFGVVIAIIFARFPSSVLPIWVQIPIAVALGFAVYKRNANVPAVTVLAVLGMYVSIAAGAWLEQHYPHLCQMPALGPIPATGLWTIILLIYGWVASTLPVTTLLQPRDYINAWQLFVMMALLAIGAAAAALQGNLPLVAPVLNYSPAQAPPMWPFLFVSIACGAISGFHALVASGTSPKQIAAEPDCQFVGYGSMLLEGALAVLVTVCVAAGIGIAYHTADGATLTGLAAWKHHYSCWSTAEGLTANITAVVVGAANMFAALKLPQPLGVALMGVFIASFAGTTLDTSVRIQRYVIGELATNLGAPILANRWVATTIAVATAAALAFATGPTGQGAKVLWPTFGATNQLLAALALLVVTMYLKRKGKFKFLVTALPCIVMLTITTSAMLLNERQFIREKNWLLAAIGATIFALAMWMTVETVILFVKGSEPARHQSGGAPA